MSWLLVRGKIFICENCNRKIKIEYKDGAQFPQIRDINIYTQLEYSKKLGQLCKNPDEEGYYLYDFGICENCIHKILSKEDFEANMKILKLINQLFTLKDIVFQKLDEIIENNKEAIFNNIDYKKIYELHKREIIDILIKGENILEISKKSRKKFKKIIKNEAYSMCKNYILNIPEIQNEIKKSKETFDIIFKKLETLLNHVNAIYDIKITDEPENLNNFIIAESTIRYPEEDSISERWYKEVSLDINSILEIREFEKLIDFEIPGEFIDSVIRKIKKLYISNA